MAAKKLTRKEIVQEDVIQKTLTETSNWATENINLLVAGLVLLLAAGGGYFAWNSYSQAQAETRQARFAEALETYHAVVESPGTETPGAADSTAQSFTSSAEKYQAAESAFTQIAQDHPGTRVAELANYYAGLSKIELGKHVEAETSLLAVVDATSDPNLRNLALNALAQNALQMDEAEKAVEYFQSILADPSEEFPREIALMRLAQTLEGAGELEAALERYQQIVNEFSGSAIAGEATTRISRLEPRVGSAADTAPSEGNAPVPEGTATDTSE